MKYILYFLLVFANSSHISIRSEENSVATVHFHEADPSSKYSIEVQENTCSLFYNDQTIIQYADSELTSSSDLSIQGELSFISLEILDTKQPILFFIEDFNTFFEGWSDMRVTSCGTMSDKFLGGPCQFSSNSVSKTFEDLPEHEQLIITFNFHFFDDWFGEYGTLKIDGKTVWQENYEWCEKVLPWMCYKFGVSVCGNEMPDRFNQFYQIDIHHSEDIVTLEFSSTLGQKDSCQASWGIDNIGIYFL